MYDLLDVGNKEREERVRVKKKQTKKQQMVLNIWDEAEKQRSL